MFLRNPLEIYGPVSLLKRLYFFFFLEFWFLGRRKRNQSHYKVLCSDFCEDETLENGL